MDDIAFFESSKYKHRGGIWADASRNERSSELFPSSTETQEDDHSTASAPVSDVPTPLATDLDPGVMQRSSSAPIEAQTSVDGSSEPLDAVPMSRAVTVSTSSTSSNNSSTRRRTWFSSSRDGDRTSPGETDTLDPQEPERGRTGAPDIDTMDNRHSRSTSLAPQESVHSDVQFQSDSLNEEVPRSPPMRRSSSRHSLSSWPQETPSQDLPAYGTSTSPADSLLSGFRSKSPAPSSSSNRLLPNSPTSNFFQTLKTRDKQAISNSAKEAMRKWGVNWGGLKKDAHASGDEAPDGEMRRQDEPKIHKPRPSYAELRAAVEQRRTSNTVDGGYLSPSPQPTEAVLSPTRGKTRTASVSSTGGLGSMPEPSVPKASSSSASSHSDRLTPDPASRPRSTSPSVPASAPRPRTLSHHSQAANDGSLNPPLEEEEQPPARPIYTQPPAPKAMTIPGIHASHRGEVMSMGYAPPPPPPSEQKKGVAIPGVYRLWKNPGAQQAQQPQSDMQPPIDMSQNDHDQAAEPSGSMSQSMTPTPSNPTPASAARPIPPPLPPRSYSTHAVQILSEPPRHPPELDHGASPATAVLQSIVSKDRTRRESLEPASSSPGRPIFTENDSTVINDSSAPDKVPSSLPLAVNPTEEIPAPKPKPPALPPRRTVVSS